MDYRIAGAVLFIIIFVGVGSITNPTFFQDTMLVLLVMGVWSLVIGKTKGKK